ncbi:NADPH dehydrogenase quinone FQR1 [Hondaea fermentalgiana]|uniref:NADPH dehydrogenase quinone FQR1 n=1 Tax=Hondaea fermentalgiana TaxID=2315210 RepID=A0A2R5GXY5_9STRA|nr:NADPH dehydrogenase quinone FQR1 [Hondaea fermentalgiana]|eukprot:GBG32834.1 NADPH dehydrogenase quinone FQR1 [Hondaea fermentalgiana]
MGKKSSKLAKQSKAEQARLAEQARKAEEEEAKQEQQRELEKKEEQKAAESKETKEDAPKKMTAKIGIVYYSMYGHVLSLAETMRDVFEEQGCEVLLMQVPETLPEEVLKKMGAPPKADHPIATPQDLASCDGLMFGIPTRFGMAAAQMKTFMDSTGQLWGEQALSGIPAGVFFATGTQGGGQETTALTFVTQLTHHGMIFVPLGYSSELQKDMKEIHGGSPYGAGTYGIENTPTELEKEIAAAQAERMASIVKRLAGV